MPASPTISVFGLGYVGTVQAACLADRGLDVIGFDRNFERMAAVAGADRAIAEPGLADLLERAVGRGRLRTCASAEEAILQSDISILCVDTPRSPDGASDISALTECLHSIAASLAARPREHVVIVRSTIPVGTMDQHVVPRFAAHEQLQCLFIPEFLREGSAIQDYRNPPKILVGCRGVDDRIGRIVDLLFGSVPAPRHFIDYRMAELAKYADNSWHALKVCFANEMAALSAAFGLDGPALMDMFREDKALNISEAYLKPGMPFGGSCLTKDLAALASMAGEAALALPLLGSILTSNDRHLDRCVDQVLETGARRIGLWGLSFKPGTGDLRDSPVLVLAERLLDEHCHLTMHDDSIFPDNLSARLRASRPACRHALDNGRLRIAGPDALDACELVVLCHSPGEQTVGREGQRVMRLYA